MRWVVKSLLRRVSGAPSTSRGGAGDGGGGFQRRYSQGGGAGGCEGVWGDGGDTRAYAHEASGSYGGYGGYANDSASTAAAAASTAAAAAAVSAPLLSQQEALVAARAMWGQGVPNGGVKGGENAGSGAQKRFGRSLSSSTTVGRSSGMSDTPFASSMSSEDRATGACGAHAAPHSAWVVGDDNHTINNANANVHGGDEFEAGDESEDDAFERPTRFRRRGTGAAPSVNESNETASRKQTRRPRSVLGLGGRPVVLAESSDDESGDDVDEQRRDTTAATVAAAATRWTRRGGGATALDAWRTPSGDGWSAGGGTGAEAADVVTEAVVEMEPTHAQSEEESSSSEEHAAAAAADDPVLWGNDDDPDNDYFWEPQRPPPPRTGQLGRQARWAGSGWDDGNDGDEAAAGQRSRGLGDATLDGSSSGGGGGWDAQHAGSGWDTGTTAGAQASAPGIMRFFSGAVQPARANEPQVRFPAVRH